MAKLPQDAEGGYLLNLRQVIFLILVADTARAKALQRFIDVLAEMQFGPRPSEEDRIEIFEAWLKGNVKGTGPMATIMLQEASEGLHQAAPDLMAMLHTLARADTRYRQC